jgi:aminoglycoside 3'-phosphotransferase-2
LTALHRLPVATCPFDQRLEVTLAEARRRIDAGEVEHGRLEAEHQGQSLESLWRALVAHSPAEEDLVVAHGDACWPNFILGPDGGVGIIDLGRFGVADRHQDLALFIRSAKHNFPDLPIEALVATHYLSATVETKKLALYRLLDEFY